MLALEFSLRIIKIPLHDSSERLSSETSIVVVGFTGSADVFSFTLCSLAF
jgi:hypothetical protein